MGNDSSKGSAGGGVGSRHAEKDVDENKVGLENFGNTCYVNSVMQALYWCLPFRQGVLHYCKERSLKHSHDDGTLLQSVGDLFHQMQHSRKKIMRPAPKKLVTKMRTHSIVFASYQQQDAHEFLVYLLNDVMDTLKLHSKEEAKSRGPEKVSSTLSMGSNSSAASNNKAHHPKPSAERDKDTESEGIESHTAGSENSDPQLTTFVQNLFEGQLAAEMKCLTCECVTSRVEDFLGLSVDVSQNVSLNKTLRNFSRGEIMDRDNKFHCDACHSLQEARRSLRIKRAPPILTIHLKRFKYIEEFGRHCKLSYRVPFPFSIRLPIDGPQSDDLYQLFAVVIHLGVGPNMGHYVCMAKSGKQWMLFDDEAVSPITERDVAQGFGTDLQTDSSTSTAYLLFYSSLPFVDSAAIVSRYVNNGAPR